MMGNYGYGAGYGNHQASTGQQKTGNTQAMSNMFQSSANVMSLLEQLLKSSGGSSGFSLAPQNATYNGINFNGDNNGGINFGMINNSDNGTTGTGYGAGVQRDQGGHHRKFGKGKGIQSHHKNWTPGRDGGKQSSSSNINYNGINFNRDNNGGFNFGLINNQYGNQHQNGKQPVDHKKPSFDHDSKKFPRDCEPPKWDPPKKPPVDCKPPQQKPPVDCKPPVAEDKPNYSWDSSYINFTGDNNGGINIGIINNYYNYNTDPVLA